MKQQLFDVLCSKVDSFIAQFEQIPINKINDGLAWEQFYFTYFSSMTNTLISSINHLDYVQFQSSVVVPKSVDNICLSFDKNNQLTRAIDFNQQNPSHQLITKYLADNLEKIRTTKETDSYQKIFCKDVVNDKKYIISGTSYLNSRTHNITLNFCIIEVKTEAKPVSSNSFTPSIDRSICKEVFEKFIKVGDCTTTSASNIANSIGLDLTTLNNNFKYYYGDEMVKHCRKERLLKSLELILFSSDEIDDIANKYGFFNGEQLLTNLNAIPHIDTNNLIRYNKNAHC